MESVLAMITFEEVNNYIFQEKKYVNDIGDVYHDGDCIGDSTALL